MDTKGGKWRGGGGGGGVMNWEIGIDMYTLICIKWITNKKKKDSGSKGMCTCNFGRNCQSFPKEVIPFILNQHYREVSVSSPSPTWTFKKYLPPSSLSLNEVVSIISLFWD